MTPASGRPVAPLPVAPPDPPPLPPTPTHERSEEEMSLPLRKLELTWVKTIAGSSLIRCAPYLQNLTEIKARGCGKWMNDGCILALARFSPLLEVMDLYKCVKITNHSVAGVVRSCTYLRVLLLGECNLLNDDVIRAIIVHGAAIDTLDFSGNGRISDSAYQSLAMLPNLKEVLLNECTLLRNASISHIAKVR